MFANVNNTSIVTSGTSQRQKLNTTGATNVNIYNNGTVEAFVWFGDSNVAADATKRVIGPGYSSFQIDGGSTYFAAICPGGTPTIYVHAGSGD